MNLTIQQSGVLEVNHFYQAETHGGYIRFYHKDSFGGGQAATVDTRTLKGEPDAFPSETNCHIPAAAFEEVALNDYMFSQCYDCPTCMDKGAVEAYGGMTACPDCTEGEGMD